MYSDHIYPTPPPNSPKIHLPLLYSLLISCPLKKSSLICAAHIIMGVGPSIGEYHRYHTHKKNYCPLPRIHQLSVASQLG